MITIQNPINLELASLLALYCIPSDNNHWDIYLECSDDYYIFSPTTNMDKKKIIINKIIEYDNSFLNSIEFPED